MRTGKKIRYYLQDGEGNYVHREVTEKYFVFTLCPDLKDAHGLSTKILADVVQGSLYDRKRWELEIRALEVEAPVISTEDYIEALTRYRIAKGPICKTINNSPDIPKGAVYSFQPAYRRGGVSYGDSWISPLAMLGRTEGYGEIYDEMDGDLKETVFRAEQNRGDLDPDLRRGILDALGLEAVDG